MASYSSAVVRESTPHAISDALRRHAQSVINNFSPTSETIENDLSEEKIYMLWGVEPVWNGRRSD